MKKTIYQLLSLLVLMTFVSRQTGQAADNVTLSCPTVKMEVTRLPDLNTSRSAHSTLFINHELVVIGGHTEGFVPTPTAEYLADGEWHQLPAVYIHDGGLAVPLRSGKVLLAGGSEQPLGIGQTFPIEYYDPAAHSFEGYGCLDVKRAYATALELDSGRLVIAGNWYRNDTIEVFNGQRQSMALKDVTVGRCRPYIFRTGTDDAIIFGSFNHRGTPLDTIWIDRLHGESFLAPLFEEWHPIATQADVHMDDAFVGDESRGLYAYLLTVVNDRGDIAIARADGEQFALVPTTVPIPVKTETGGTITYVANLTVDRKRQRAYLLGHDEDYRICVTAVDYARTPAPVTLYYSDPRGDWGWTGGYAPVVMDDGNLAFAGGVSENNFNCCASAFVLHVANQLGEPASVSSVVLCLLALVLLAVVVCAIVWRRRRGKTALVGDTDGTLATMVGEKEKADTDEELLQRICLLMEQERMYLRSDLKVSDVANELGVNARYVSDCIRLLRNTTFTNFVNAYRVDYAKQQLRDHPDKKISEVYLASGFANETTFFRTFKSFCGMTPREWMAGQEALS